MTPGSTWWSGRGFYNSLSRGQFCPTRPQDWGRSGSRSQVVHPGFAPSRIRAYSNHIGRRRSGSHPGAASNTAG